MSHNEERGDWWIEGLASMISGIGYGITNVLAGSPMDVIKTKMQVFDEYKKLNAFQTAKAVYQRYGIQGFYKGVTGPLLGSSMFRGIQFASFEAFYTKFKDNKLMTEKIPYTLGLEPRVILGGVFSGTCRATLESPFEYTKVRRQTNNSWVVKDLYTGFRATWLKATGLMVTYFTLTDTLRRNTNNFNNKFLTFLTNGFCSTFAFIIIWPFEIVKNKVQKENLKKYSINKFIRNNIRENGIIKGLYRGAGPGLGSVFVRNGTSMIIMQYLQKFLTKIGFRETKK